MVLKIKRLFLALYYTVMNCLGYLCARRHTIRPVWLISERGFDARDNGYHLYNWICRNHPEIDVRYVIGKKDKDREKLMYSSGKDDRTVRRGSFKHFRLMHEAQALISTHAFGWSPDMVVYNHLYKAHLFRPKGKTVFLQHGVTDKDIEFMYRKNFAPDLFITSTVKETEYVLNTCKQPAGVVAMTGMCRFDNLDGSKTDSSKILFMPTWRLWLQYSNRKSFTESDYFKKINDLLKSEELNRLLERENKTLLFYPHIEMQKYMDAFEPGERVKVLDAGTADVQALLKECAVLITDYSSVYFDFLYMKKPVIFYQWDKEEYASKHYQGFIEKHEAYGPVAKDEASLMKLLEFELKNPKKSTASPFTYADKKNCHRVFKAIKECLR